MTERNPAMLAIDPPRTEGDSAINWAAVSDGLRTLSDQDLHRLRQTLVFLYANTEPASKARH
jgi:hypothetical protein